MGKLNFKSRQSFGVLFIVAVGMFLAALILFSERGGGDGHGHEAESPQAQAESGESGHGHEHGGGAHGEEKAAKGPHGGDLFAEGDFRLEVRITEDEGGPRLRAWLFSGDQAIPPGDAKVSATLTRPDGEKQDYSFAPAGDALVSTAVVPEPHVFEGTLAAMHGGESYLFPYFQQEGKVRFTNEQIKSAGITISTAGPARIRSTLQLPGEIRFNEDRTAHVVPRVNGVVQGVQANLGQQVKRGQVLAVLASTQLSEYRSELNAAQKRLELARLTYEREQKLWQEKISAEQDYLQARQAVREAEIAVQNARQKLSALGASPESAGALSRFELRAPFDGMVVEKHIALGEAVKEDANVFTVSDLSTVWAEINVPPRDLNLVRVGEKVTVKAAAFESSAPGVISYVGALVGEQTRTAKARATLPNPRLAWRPGLFVTVELVSEESDVPVTVSTDALQTLDDKTVVFVKIDGGFIPQPVVTGRSNGRQVEIVKGLKPGMSHAAAGSFVVKAELGKGTAEHTH